MFLPNRRISAVPAGAENLTTSSFGPYKSFMRPAYLILHRKVLRMAIATIVEMLVHIPKRWKHLR
jgi:hypothetical protein